MIKHIASEKLETKGKTYYFNTNETESGERFLAIAETRLVRGQRMRNEITVFHNNTDEFVRVLSGVVARLKQ